MIIVFFFFNDTATTEIYTLSLHDALPISDLRSTAGRSPGTAAAGTAAPDRMRTVRRCPSHRSAAAARSEEHTSELQSRLHLVCRLLLEKKNKNHSFLPLDAIRRQTHQPSR